MLEETSCVPAAVCWTLRAISCVAEPWLFNYYGDRGGDVADLADGPADTADRLDSIVSRGLDLGDLVSDVLGRLGGLVRQALHLGCHDGEPLPASPARAASIVAFNARRLVWPAMLLIRPTISPTLGRRRRAPAQHRCCDLRRRAP
jgi:hypothetical protein